MLRRHLEQLRPTCPVCGARGIRSGPLQLSAVAKSDGDDVIEGILLCPERRCQREHPIIDGIPIVVSDLMSWATHQLDAVLRRDDLSPLIESIAGDAAGPGSSFDRERGNVGAYAWVHWGDFDPASSLPRDSSMAALLDNSAALLPSAPEGVWIDTGCAVGRGTLEIAQRTGSLVVGLDLSFAMLRVAERVRREGRAVFARRRVGVVYDRFELNIPYVPADRMTFWCADVAVLPFADATFDGALSLNVVDCVASPLGHLIELGRVLRPGAPVLFSSPYDWSAQATQYPQWLGGHSQRWESQGSSLAELHRILSPDAGAGIDTKLVIETERDRVPWRVYVHERACMDYAVHLALLRRKG